VVMGRLGVGLDLENVCVGVCKSWLVEILEWVGVEEDLWIL
jgi:hypothetical protein